MPVPKRKRSKARRDKRFANKGMEVKSFTKCANCDTEVMPHQACGFCGFYKGVKVMSVKMDRVIKRFETRSLRQKRAAQETAPLAEEASSSQE